MLSRLVLHNDPSLSDHEVFHAAKVERSSTPYAFAERKYEALPPMELWLQDKHTDRYGTLEEFLIKNKTTAFMVLQNDTIIYENYFNGLYKDKPSIVFSVTKAVMTTLTSIAIDEGFIEGTDVLVSEFIPEYKDDPKRSKITLNHLINMTSGLDWEDKVNVVKLAKAYYSKDVNDLVRSVKCKYEPGERFSYKSIDTQLLGICLELAIGRPAFEYLQEKLWEPLGMEFDAYFTLDRKKGTARMYGGLAACTRDLMKIGRLYLHQGNWNGKQILNTEWCKSTSSRVCNTEKWWGYANGFWLEGYQCNNLFEANDFYMAGFKGQVVYINPTKNLIIVRQGLSQNKIKWELVCARLANTLNNPTHKKINRADAQLIGGKYENAKGDAVFLKKEEGRWEVSFNKQKPWEFTEESPQSLLNSKKKKRIILEYNDDRSEIIGLYVDDFRNAVFYNKSDPALGALMQD